MTQARRAAAKRRRLLTGALSVAGHAVVLFLLLSAQPPLPRAPEAQPISVALVQLPPPLPETPTPRSDPEPPAKPPPRTVARPAKAPPPRDVIPLPAGKGPSADSAEVSEGQLATAATAASGGGGRACDMTQRLQTALRKDPQVQAAIAEAHRGRALMVWNGDWVRHEGQEGDGLAAVREAIMWEVGFAPAACRTEPMRGLVAISLNDGPAASRLVMGSGDWRWADLLKIGGRGPTQR